MHLKKTFVLVALVAAAVAPSAGARLAPPEPQDPSAHFVPGAQGIIHKKAQPNKAQPTLCVRYLQSQSRCLAFGLQ